MIDRICGVVGLWNGGCFHKGLLEKEDEEEEEEVDEIFSHSFLNVISPASASYFLYINVRVIYSAPRLMD